MADDDLTFLGFGGKFKKGSCRPAPAEVQEYGARPKVRITIEFEMVEGPESRALQEAMRKAALASARRGDSL
jgi:hypothetical protein